MSAHLPTPDEIYLQSLEQKAKTGALPEELTIKEIGLLLSKETGQQCKSYSLLINACEIGLLKYTGNISEKAQDRSCTKYTGDRLSLNFQELEIRSVIAIFAELTGQNLVAGDDVTGTVTMKLDDVPWDEALDFILMTKYLDKYETGNITLISSLGGINSRKEDYNNYYAVVDPLNYLIKHEDLKAYFQNINFWPVVNCLLANWWTESELQTDIKPQTKPQHDDDTPKTKRTTKLNAWLREKWDEWDKPNARDFAAKLKPFQGALGSPVKKILWLASSP